MRLRLALAAMLLPIVATPAAAQIFPSSAGNLKVETVAGGLVHPWSLAFLPDGRMLVTERPGRMRIVTRAGQLSPPLAGVPEVFAQSQAGLMDVTLARDFAQSRMIFFCYAEHADGGGGRIAVAHAQLDDNSRAPRLNAVKVIFRQQGPASRGLNIGCRMVQAADGNLFVILGDHFAPAKMAQTLDNHIGKIVRIRPDGSAPADNPLVGRKDALPEIWAYGLRNAEGLAFSPIDGKLYEQEHGPMGGDEINIIAKAKNYGWPVIGYGIDYNGARIHESTHKAGIEQPVKYWVPSIAPSGMAFYTGNLFPAWKGSLFNGALKFQMLDRLALDGDRVTGEERLLEGLRERIRDVRQGPDGALYLLTDNSRGRILRLAPAK